MVAVILSSSSEPARRPFWGLFVYPRQNPDVAKHIQSGLARIARVDHSSPQISRFSLNIVLLILLYKLFGFRQINILTFDLGNQYGKEDSGPNQSARCDRAVYDGAHSLYEAWQHA